MVWLANSIRRNLSSSAVFSNDTGTEGKHLNDTLDSTLIHLQYYVTLCFALNLIFGIAIPVKFHGP
jgi:hypothetical protein